MPPSTTTSRAALATLLALLATLVLAAGSASAAPAVAGAKHRAESQPVALATLLTQLNLEYRQGFPSHDPIAAEHARGMAAAVVNLAARAPGHRSDAAQATAARLVSTLSATSFALQIWPEPDSVSALILRVRELLSVPAAVAPAGTSAALSSASALAVRAGRAASAGDVGGAAAALAQAYATFTLSLAPRLEAVAPEQVTQTDGVIWHGISTATAAALARSATTLAADLHEDAATLGQVKVSRATIVSDAAIILFREGLEAVLILAAITASFTGERRRLRRLVFAGAGLGLLATAVTYVLAQVIIDAFGDGGLRLQAITGILAIVVLLVVTNWFFHRIYWSEWISRFNRRRRALEKLDRIGFISGQALGFVILGLTSVYREGFETVLFLQNLQVSAGTGATLLGVAIGLTATLIVGLVTFALGRKLPYRKMLILTGVLIGLVLAVMVGTTVNNLQGLGWIPSHAAGFTVDTRLSQWTGLYATWEGLSAQFAALLVVYGSYALSRQIQGHRRRRAVAVTSDVTPA